MGLVRAGPHGPVPDGGQLRLPMGCLRMGDGTGHSFICVWLPDSRQAVIYDEGGVYTYD